MPKLHVSNVIDAVRYSIQDASGVRWTTTQLLTWYNEAMLDAVYRNPSLLYVSRVFRCIAGAVQGLADDTVAIMDVGPNVGPVAAPAAGETPCIMEKELFDTLHPAWQNDATSNQIKLLLPTRNTPQYFFVWPPQASAGPGGMWLTVSLRPTMVDGTMLASDIQFNNEHAPIIHDYILYRAFMMDSENPQLLALAQQHYQSYLNLVVSGMPQQERK